MNKIIVVLLVMAICFTLVSCGQKIEVSRTAIDKRFTPAHTETEVKLDIAVWLLTDIPYIRNEAKYISDTYEIMYLISYDNGTVIKKWETVSEADFNKIRLEGEK